ncbi:hypothetical protein AVEN_193257-1 [Araneus ventricosus]|uniref:Uncharacterized protein n=1 Tax=Araneus ventricosus TaxID=182803 RepID=A0A4Y2HML4_ARAVE|nr:hypothetical protein AVEN_193257-1 [Araneus ventricosus]
MASESWLFLTKEHFEDYHRLKPRKSNDKRQRFLVAMTACPFIEPLKEISTSEEKYYKFRAHGTSSVDATDEIAALSASNEDVEMQEIPVVSTAENGPPTGGTSMEDNVCDLQIGNDLGNCLSPMLDDSNNSLLGVLDGFEIDEELRTDIDQLLEQIDSAVPDVTANELESPEIGAATSLYNDSVDLMRSSPSFSEVPDSSDLWNLQGEEVSYRFEVRAGNGDVPPDYDPVKDLIESMGTPKPAERAAVDPLTIPEADPNQLGSVQVMPGISGESSKCQSSVRVFKLDDNDGIVRSLRGDNLEKKFYMMVLNPESM